MKNTLKVLCVAIVLAGLLAVFCEDSRLFMSAKTAEAGEVSMSYANQTEGYTASAINASSNEHDLFGEPYGNNTAVQRFLNVVWSIGKILLFLVVVAFVLSGLWIPLAIGGLFLTVIWAVISYILGM